MKYREMGNTGKKVSVLGFGMMRLPVNENDAGKINEKQAREMVEFALDAGINYLDTAYPYHKGMSEGFTGTILNNGWRDKVYVADKLPGWLIKKPEDLDKYLQEQLSRLGVEKIDFYLLHALNARSWENLKKQNTLEWLAKKKREGVIDHAGFSFHDQLPVFKEILSSYEWEFCQIQYNYMDIEFQAGQAGLELAAQKGAGIIIMEPLKGGLLAKEPPQEILELYKAYNYNDTPASLALRWIWQQDKISIVLSGMSTLDQVKENIKLASGEDKLNPSKQELVTKIQKMYLDRIKVPCTGCEYCLPCPQQVAIPAIFDFYNTAKIYDDQEWGRKMYNVFLEPDYHAEKCVECGECESKCPQQIKIIEKLKAAKEYLRVQK